MKIIEKGKFRATGSKKTSALSQEQFEYVLGEFRRRDDLRMEILCLFMARCIRIGDVLNKIKIHSVYADSGEILPTVSFREEKTGKGRTFHTEKSHELRTALIKYYPRIKHETKSNPLFYGSKTGLPLKDKGVRFLLSEFIGQAGIMQCSPHSFRKYGARSLWLRGVPIEIISEILNHSNVRETRVYLDIKSSEVEKALLMLEV